MAIVFFSVNGAGGGGGGGGTVNGANNGLSLLGTVAQLGGNPLIQNSNIETGAFTFSLNGVTAPAPGGNYYAFGDSITAGIGSIIHYPDRIASALGYTLHNMGLSGTTLEKRVPLFAPTNMIDEIPTIPVKGINDKLISFQFGVNDINFAGVNYNAANFLADYTTVINATIAKGWLPEDIIIFSTTYQDPANYGTIGAGGGVILLSTQLAFNANALAVSNTFGTHYADVFNAFSNGAKTFWLADTLHPNDMGTQVMSDVAISGLDLPVFLTGQTFAVNGVTALQTLELGTLEPISDANVILLAFDKSNNQVGQTNSLPDNTRTQEHFYLGGQTIQEGAIIPTLPAVVAPNDIYLQNNQTIYGAFPGASNWFGYLRLSDGGVSARLGTSYPGGSVVLLTADGGGHPKETLRAYNGDFVTIGDGTDPHPFQTAGDVWLLPGTINGGSGVGASQAGGYGKFIPFNGAFTDIVNTFGTGLFRQFMSDGVTGNKVQMSQMQFNGRIRINEGIDFTDIPTSRFTIDSTTEGILRPRMTTAQKNAIVLPAEGLMVYDLTLHQPFYYNGTIWVVG